MAGMTLSFKPSGFPDAANKYPAALRAAVNLGLKAQARDVADYARMNHQYITRRGASGADGSIGFKAHPATLEASVGFDLGVAAHGLMLNDGTKRHWVGPKNKKALRFVGKNGRWWFSKGHFVSGIKAMKFVEGAAYRLGSHFVARMDAAVASASGAIQRATPPPPEAR
jgi:hypothetical protein